MPRMDADGETHTEGDETSPWGVDHSLGTGNSIVEDPLQPIEDLAEATDGDGNDGGFANPAAYFAGLSDPDGDGQQEETLLGHETDLPDEPDTDPEPDASDPSPSPDGSEDDYQLTADDLPDVVPVPSGSGMASGSGGQSSMMAVVAVVVAAVAAVVALAGGGGGSG